MQRSGYSLDRLRDDGEFIQYRAHAKQMELPSVLPLAPASTQPSPETLKKIDHEYSLRGELDSAWAVRPLALSERGAQMTLVLDDPGGETLDGCLSRAMQMNGIEAMRDTTGELSSKSFDCRVAEWPRVGHRELRKRGDISVHAAPNKGGARVTPADDATVFVIDDDARMRAATQRLLKSVAPESQDTQLVIYIERN